VYENGHSYRKEHVLAGHSGPITQLFSEQNLLISTNLITIKMWDQLTGECLHVLTTEQQQEEKPNTTTQQETTSEKEEAAKKSHTRTEKEYTFRKSELWTRGSYFR